MKYGYFTCIAIVIGLLVGCAPSLDDKSVNELNDLGVSQMGQYQYAAAFETFTKVVNEDPENDAAVVNLAISILNRQDPGDEQLALSTLARVLERNPKNARAQYTSGIIQLYLGFADEALQHFIEAFALDPDDAFTSYFLGQTNLQLGNYKGAKDWFLRAIDIKPVLRSAYWAASTAARREGHEEEALKLIDQYQELEHNPLSVTAGFSYKEMGPNAEAVSFEVQETSLAELPEGSLFADPIVLKTGLDTISSIATVDTNDDASWDLVVVNGETTTLMSAVDISQGIYDSVDGFIDGSGHVSFGHFNNDDVLNVVLCNREGVKILDVDGQMVANRLSATPCQSNRIADIDHDGDLDVLVATSQGVELFTNNLDGTFSSIESIREVTQESIRQLLLLDLDADRDVDLVLLGADGVNAVLLNLLGNEFEVVDLPEEFRNSASTAATSVDLDLDGYPEVILGDAGGGLTSWSSVRGRWNEKTILHPMERPITQLDARDFNGDGSIEVLMVYEDSFEIIKPERPIPIVSEKRNAITYAISVYTNPQQGPALITASEKGLELWPAGLGRFDFLAIATTGKTSADQMRSNASGIGTRLRLRVSDRWSLASPYLTHSGPSQSLAPVSFGSGGSEFASYVDILWTDGVSQSESNLAFGELHQIEEVQRQLASCPVVFAWNGEKYEFVSDVLGVGALGFYASPGETTPVRPFERLRFKDGFLKPREGYYEVKVGEPMEEVLYLDHARLLAYDLPEDTDLVLDERLNVKSVAPTGEPIFFTKVFEVEDAYNQDGEDVTSLLESVDLEAPSPGEVDSRFVGLMDAEHSVTLEFEEELPVNNSVLVADGWMEFPYSQTVHAAHQAGAPYLAPSLEARDTSGNWHLVAKQFGYPAGMPRQMSLPIDELPEGTNALRISSNMEIYWDRIQVIESDESLSIEPHILEPHDASVKTARFALRSTGPQRTPYYDYDKRTPYWDAKHAEGNYTITGEITPLLESKDSSVAIVGSGEEVHLRFKPLDQEERGFTRVFVLEVNGWAKDMDLYTFQGATVEPVPSLSDMTPMQNRKRKMLHDRFNVRFQSGMPPR